MPPRLRPQTPTGAADMLKGLKGNSSESRALLGQILQNSFSEGIKQQGAQGRLGSGGFLPQAGGMPGGRRPEHYDHTE